MKQFDYAVLGDPAVFRENREPPHSDHLWKLPGGGDPRLSLNGKWYFHYAENLAGTVPDFFAAGFDCSGWDTIPVPSHIQLQGYGHPQYVNVQYPWDGCETVAPGEAPGDFNPVGSYIRLFTLPDWMAGKRVYLSFQGAESALAVWVNGNYVGYGEDGFTPSEFEITDYLIDGENRLAVQVFRWTAASWYEDQDFFRFSGLFRDVYLYAVPHTHVRDLSVATRLSDGFSRAAVEISTETLGSGSLLCRLYDGERETARQEGPVGVPLTLTVDRPRLWSAEDPALYRLELTVLDGAGEVTEVITQPVGIRRFAIENGLMLLNGKRILFRGVNRHEFSARHGRCVSEEETLQDILTMKRNNINAIRTSHYPNQSFLYRLCDEYGLYVIDEANIESHGAWNMVELGRIPLSEHIPGDDPKWLPGVLARAEAMVRRDRNHPSVLIWSCGNEAFGGRNLLEVSRYLHRVDTRPVHYEGTVRDTRYPETSDIFSNMYWPAEDIRAALEKDSSKPAISCEYGHAMGNSFGNQLRYALLAEEVPAYQGGFIWDYIDQAIEKKDRFGNPFLGYGGDFGDRPNDGNFSGDGIVYAGTRLPSPKMQEVKAVYQNLRLRVADGGVEVANHYLFTSTAAFVCVEQLFREGVLLGEASLETDVPPGERGSYPLPLWPEKLDGEYSAVVSFRLREDCPWAPAGHEVAFGEWTGGTMAVQPRPARMPEVVDGAWNLGVRGENFRILFSKAKQAMTSYRYKGRELIQSAPMPNFWRAPTDNDKGCQAPFRFAQWKAASLYAVPGTLTGEPSCRIARGENYVEITFSYLLPTSPRSGCAAAYRVFAGGEVEVTLTSDAAKTVGPMPEFGMLLKMDADFHRLRWYGRGPEETYCDRKTGGRLGVYETTAEESMAAYLAPQECGNRTGVRWAEVTDGSGVGLRFEGEGMEFSALPYTPHELENAAHPHELPPVHHTVVRAALMQMGLGGDDSWGARPAAEYLLPKKPLTFRFTLRAVGGEEQERG